MATRLLLTCEHGGNRVPAAYRRLFHAAKDELASHRGWDPGALRLAGLLQRRLSAPLLALTSTRLLVEPNRSLGHRHLFSKFTAGLDRPTKQQILDAYYHPHRRRVESWIDSALRSRNRVVHVSVHTFTPQLNGQIRRADVGLLYDPQREQERVFCSAWHALLKQMRPDVQVRRNYPYLGRADGLTTHLRRCFPPAYLGIELEVNQCWLERPAAWKRLGEDLAASLASAVHHRRS